jgi:pimeloyl-ACP methyl ester carboxylesterase
MPTDGTFVTPDGITLHYVDYGGEGAPLVLLHGLTGYARSWDEIAGPLTKMHRVYALDQRGHGDSEHTPDYSVKSFGADVAAFATHLGLATYALCGLSLGARNAIAAGGEDGARMSHLVLVDMAPEMARTGARRVRTNIGGQVDLERGFADEDEAYGFAISQAEFPENARVQQRTRNGLKFALRTGEDGRLRYKYDPALFQITGKSAVAEQPYLWECLERTPCPTLVVRGETSDILSPELVEKMLEKLPKGESVEILGAGHPVPYDQPERFLHALETFLAK